MGKVIRIILKATILFVLLISAIFLLNVALTELGYQSILWTDFMLKISTQHDFGIVIFMAWFLVFLIIWAFPKLFE